MCNVIILPVFTGVVYRNYVNFLLKPCVPVRPAASVRKSNGTISVDKPVGQVQQRTENGKKIGLKFKL